MVPIGADKVQFFLYFAMQTGKNVVLWFHRKKEVTPWTAIMIL